ncbi:MAG: hypothetical protein AAB227_06435 [Pseudomonadota bacterium]
MVTKKPQPKTDKAQSEKFKALAKELEAAGELDLTEAENKFAKEVGRIAKSKTPHSP